MFKKLITSIFFSLTFLLLVASTWFYLNLPSGAEVKQVLPSSINPYNHYLVQVTGQVVNPGIYEVDPTFVYARVIELAGGFTKDADAKFISEKLNLAQKINDGESIFIPSINPSSKTTFTNDSTNNLININTASVKELESLPGIGEVTASKIVQARPFSSIDQLKDISGISDSKFNEIKELIQI